MTKNEHIASVLLQERLLKFEQVFALVGFSRNWIYRAIAEGRFPKPVKFGRASRWRLSEVTAWMNGVSSPMQQSNAQEAA